MTFAVNFMPEALEASVSLADSSNSPICWNLQGFEVGFKPYNVDKAVGMILDQGRDDMEI